MSIYSCILDIFMPMCQRLTELAMNTFFLHEQSFLRFVLVHTCYYDMFTRLFMNKMRMNFCSFVNVTLIMLYRKHISNTSNWWYFDISPVEWSKSTNLLLCVQQWQNENNNTMDEDDKNNRWFNRMVRNIARGKHRAEIRTHRIHIQWMHTAQWAMDMHTHSYIYLCVLCAHTTATLLLKNRFKLARTHTECIRSVDCVLYVLHRHRKFIHGNCLHVCRWISVLERELSTLRDTFVEQMFYPNKQHIDRNVCVLLKNQE